MKRVLAMLLILLMLSGCAKTEPVPEEPDCRRRSPGTCAPPWESCCGKMTIGTAPWTPWLLCWATAASGWTHDFGKTA